MDKMISNYKSSKEKAFVLPTTIISMLIISIFSALILTFVMSTTLSSNLLIKNSTSKLQYEKIFYDFKTNNLSEYDDLNYNTYSAYDLQTKQNLENENIKAIVVFNKNSICFFGLYDFTEGNECEIVIQKNNFELVFDENLNFEFYGFYFVKDIANSIT